MDPARPGVTLALVDTGYTATRESGPGVFVGVRNYVANNTNTTDDEGHGTTVGNIMHAQTGNGFGVAGVQYATPSKVLVYKVLDGSGSGSMDDVISAVKDAADGGARVINCSLGGSGYDSAGRPIPGVQQAWDDALAYVTATWLGRRGGLGQRERPGRLPGRGEGCGGGRRHRPVDGSAFVLLVLRSAARARGSRPARPRSTPRRARRSRAPARRSPRRIVAASLGMLWSLLPKATPASVTSAVLSTARDLGPAGFDNQYGNGELDVWAAYRKLMDTFPTQPPISVSVSGTPGFTTRLHLARRRRLRRDLPLRHRRRGVARPRRARPPTSTSAPTARTRASWPPPRATCSRVRAATVGFTVSTGRPALLSRRFAGADRYGTAAAVSRSAFPTSAPSVVIASGEGFPDALSASVLAYRSGAPLLLTRRTSLPKDTADEIARLHPSSAVIVGRDARRLRRRARGARGPRAERDADRRRRPLRDGRAGRARRARPRGRACPRGTVVVASGENFPDALAASPMAAAAGYPILLTRRDSLPAATSRALRRARRDAHDRRRRHAPPSPTPPLRRCRRSTRIAGRDRYETSRMVADARRRRGHPRPKRTRRRDRARASPTRSSGGVLMARLGGPMVLGDGGDAAMDAWLAGIGDGCERVDVFGSETVRARGVRRPRARAPCAACRRYERTERSARTPLRARPGRARAAGAR